MQPTANLVMVAKEEIPYSYSVSPQPNSQQPVITLGYTKLTLWEVPHIL